LLQSGTRVSFETLQNATWKSNFQFANISEIFPRRCSHLTTG